MNRGRKQNEPRSLCTKCKLSSALSQKVAQIFIGEDSTWVGLIRVPLRAHGRGHGAAVLGQRQRMAAGPGHLDVPQGFLSSASLIAAPYVGAAPSPLTKSDRRC